MSFKASEFIQNKDGSIYHLNLLPEHLADTIITVGDPERVGKITQYFDEVEFSIQKREFHTQTGTFKGKRISVLSTGIGTDNIDIVLNELDALANIDFQTRTIKQDLKCLEIYRIGTTGALQKDLGIDSFLVSEAAIGFDTMLHFYNTAGKTNERLEKSLVEHLNWENHPVKPYAVNADNVLFEKFNSTYFTGVTVTNCGFYGPQGRVLRLKTVDPNLNDKLASFRNIHYRITNLEMETAGIYGLAALLGHKAVSLNAIIANRATGEFSKDPGKLVDNLIQESLEVIAS